MKNNKSINNASRRTFLKSAGLFPLLKYTPLLSSTLLGFTLNSSAFAADCNQQQSLVCVFLMGGADSFNFVVPGGNAYNDYATTRGAMAVPSANLLPSSDAAQGDFGFYNRLPGLHGLYQHECLAVISNVGNLIRPTSKTDFNASTSLPQSSFAHDAQQKLWQIGSGNLADAFGWGGSITQRIKECNTTSNVATSITADGSKDWLNNLQDKLHYP